MAKKRNLLIITISVVVLGVTAGYFLFESYAMDKFVTSSTMPSYSKEIKQELIKRIKNTEEIQKKITTNHFDEFSKMINQSRLAFWGDDFDTLFNRGPNPIDYYGNQTAIRSSEFIVENNKTEFKVSAILKNVTKDMINVSVNDRFLIVNINQKTKSENKTENSVSSSESMSVIQRVIKMPRNVDTSKANVTFKDDVLVITMPKTESEEQNIIELKVN